VNFTPVELVEAIPSQPGSGCTKPRKLIPAQSFAMSSLAAFENLDISEKTKEIIAEYIWLAILPH
jgi:hypothetical protein